jgi:hypothetical protein
MTSSEQQLPTTSADNVQSLSVSVAGIFPTDKALYCSPHSIKMKDHLGHLVKTGACQPREADMSNNVFPSSLQCDGKKRKFNSSAYESKNPLGESMKHLWLAYSYRADHVYCHACWLFGDNETQKSPWVRGMSKWKSLSKAITTHASSACHHRSTVALHAYQKRKSIDAQLNAQVDLLTEKWRYVLNVQFGLLRVLCSLGLPLRGHREGPNDAHPGVYISMLEFISTLNPLLADHMKSENRIKYLSKTISEEQVHILGKCVQQHIVKECREAKFFTVIADSTTDISHKDQLAILLRYVRIDSETKEVELREHFMGYFHVTDSSAQGLCQLIYSSLFDTLQLEKRFLRGQAYDGAAVMSGQTGGVQALMRRKLKEEGHTFVPYVHCPPHQLNLVLVHAAESGTPPPSVEVANMFALVQRIYCFFSSSNRRWEMLLSEAESEAEKFHLVEVHRLEFCESVDEEEEESGRGRPLCLKSLSTTRWAARCRAVTALLKNFSAVYNCLGRLVEERHNSQEMVDANGLYYSMDWTFLLSLLWWNDVLHIVDSTCRLLQAKTNDLFMVVDSFVKAASDIHSLRTDSRLNDYVSSAKSMWSANGFPEETAAFKQVRWETSRHNLYRLHTVI